MSKNFIQDGKAITVAAPGATASGDFVVVGELRGVAVADAESGESVTVLTSGVFDLPAGAGVSVGEAVEWNGTQCVDLSAGDKIGVAVTSTSGGVAAVKIDC
jgi:predicted RecA/RadA family phage recombinase